MTEKIPVVRQRSVASSAAVCAVILAVVCVTSTLMGSSIGIVVGAVGCLVYSIATQALVASHHRKGMRLTRHGQHEEAIREFEASYRFFHRHAWLDRFRAIVFISPSAISYTEMSLVNIAYCYGQLGNGPQAKEYYEKTLREFPESSAAKAALRLIESVQREGEP